MSRGPYWMPDARWGSKMGPATMLDPVQGSLKDPFHDILMGVTAENLAERMSISREDQDAFAVESHRRAAAAWEAGKFDDEIVPVPVRVKRDTVDFAQRRALPPRREPRGDGQAQADLQAARAARSRPATRPA